MTYRRTTTKPSTPKRQDHHRRVTSTLQDDASDDEYNSVVQSDESRNDSEPNQPENEADSFANSDSRTDPPLSYDRFSSASTNLPYVHIASFPIFRGGSDECPAAHLSRFGKVCRANNASSAGAMARIFPVTLEDEASLWYDLNIEPYESLAWEEIKSSFSDAFGSAEPAESLQSELATLRQGDEESVRSYFLRLQWMMRKLPGHGLSDEMLREIFVRGLRRDLRDSVAAQRPGSLSEALRLAFGVRPNVAAARKCGFCGGVHAEKGCAAPARVRRSVSMAAGEAEAGMKKKGQSQRQCQCWKHQCWKRNGLERSSSNVSANYK